jgi:glutamate carboxypeptidase
MHFPATITDISSRSDELRSLLIRFADQNSGSENPSGLRAMAEMLRGEFAKIAAHEGSVELVPLPNHPAPAVRVTFHPRAPRQILFSGHFDTVYGASHAFQKCDLLDSVTLRGPGVIDMKGGLVVLLAALEAFLETASAANIGGEILLSPDEEIGSAATRAILEAAARSDKFSFALVFEPARENGDLVRARMGTGIFTATCRGRAAHAGRAPEQGRNAIVALAEYLPQVHALNREFPGVLLNIGRIFGGEAVNIVPDLATAEINIRIARVPDADRVLARLRALAEPINQREGFSLEIEGAFNRLPKEITPIDEALFRAWQNTAADLGVQVGWQDVGGGSDGNLLAAAGLATLDGLGPVGGHMHSPNEYVSLPSLVERAQVAALFLHRLAENPGWIENVH